jgi:uncharacterized protein (DUF1778 family)
VAILERTARVFGVEALLVSIWFLGMPLCTADSRTFLLICPPARRTVKRDWGTLLARIQRQQHSRKEQRLEARVTPEQKRLIERAATLRGTTITEFVVRSAQEAATNTIRDFEVLHLQDEAREVFLNAVLNPPAPNDAARAAAGRYKKQMGL